MAPLERLEVDPDCPPFLLVGQSTSAGLLHPVEPPKKPRIGAVETSSALGAVQAFLARAGDASQSGHQTALSADPEIAAVSEAPLDVQLPGQQAGHAFAMEAPDEQTQSRQEVQIDLGLGVYDVAGCTDALISRGVPEVAGCLPGEANESQPVQLIQVCEHNSDGEDAVGKVE